MSIEEVSTCQSHQQNAETLHKEYSCIINSKSRLICDSYFVITRFSHDSERIKIFFAF